MDSYIDLKNLATEELKMVMDTITGEISSLGHRIGGLEDRMDQMDRKID